MSVLLAAASSHYLEMASAVVSSPSFTFGAWVKSTSDSANQCAIGIANHLTPADFFFLALRGADSDEIEFAARQNAGDTTYYPAETTTGYTTSTWHLAVGVANATNDRRVYIDGGSKGTNSGETTPDSLSRTSIGRLSDSSPADYFDGKIAYAFIYNYAMNDAQVAALYAAQNPLNYDAGNLISCWPLTADYNDAVGSNHMTAYNTPSISADNPFSASVGPRNLLTLGCG